MTTQRLEQKARQVLALAFGEGCMEVAVRQDTVNRTYSVYYWPINNPNVKTVLYLQESH